MVVGGGGAGVTGSRFATEPALTLSDQLRNPGYAVVFSRTLGGLVVWLCDTATEVPSRWRDAMTYTHRELQIVVEDGWDADGIRWLHERKRLFHSMGEARLTREPWGDVSAEDLREIVSSQQSPTED